MPYIEIIKATYVFGAQADVGEIFEVDAETARLGVETKKARIVDGPKEAPIPAKPKATKVTRKPAAPESE